MTLLAVGLLLAAASTTPSGATSRMSRVQQISACTAATRQDVQQALRSPIEIGRLHQDAGGSTCDYTGETGQVTITLRRSVAPLDFNAEVANLKAAVPEGRLVEVPISGARAMLLDLEDSGAQLHVLRNGRDYLLVSVLGFGNSAQARAIAESIAHRALARF